MGKQPDLAGSFLHLLLAGALERALLNMVITTGQHMEAELEEVREDSQELLWSFCVLLHRLGDHIAIEHEEIHHLLGWEMQRRQRGEVLHYRLINRQDD